MRDTAARDGMAVILDMDGLMLDTEPVYRLAWQRALGELGHSFDDGLYLRLVGRNNQDADAVLGEVFGEAFPHERFRRRWLEHWRAHATLNGIRRKPGLNEILDLIDEYGVPKAVATSSDLAETRFSLELAGLDGRFGVVVTGDEITDGKPAPDIFLAAAGRLGVPPERCIAFEDSEAGVRAACSAGMRTIMIPDLQRPSDTVAALAFRVVPDLHAARPLLVNAWSAG